MVLLILHPWATPTAAPDLRQFGGQQGRGTILHDDGALAAQKRHIDRLHLHLLLSEPLQEPLHEHGCLLGKPLRQSRGRDAHLSTLQDLREPGHSLICSL